MSKQRNRQQEQQRTAEADTTPSRARRMANLVRLTKPAPKPSQFPTQPSQYLAALQQWSSHVDTVLVALREIADEEQPQEKGGEANATAATQAAAAAQAAKQKRTTS